MNRNLVLAITGLLLAVGCAPTATTAPGSAAAAGASATGTTGSAQVHALCSACVADLDCGPAGTAACITETSSAAGHCAPGCQSDADCDVNAACFPTNGSLKVCYPKTQTCSGFVTSATTSAGATSGGTSASTVGSTSTGTTTGGATTTTAASSTTGRSTSGAGASSTTTTGTSAASTTGTSAASSTSGTSTTATSSTTGTSSTTATSGTTGISSTSGSTGTGVGPQGGSVSLLHFGMTGDTRPPACEDTANYPTPIIDSIADQWQAKGAQFAVDMGDHMYVCNNTASIAQQHMALYTQAVSRFGGTTFMSMGNHECMGLGSGYCPTGSQNVNFQAFLQALGPISSTPYYSVNINTSLGLATFVFVADNSWDSVQQSWLDQTLATADAQARYTIIVKHHPAGDTSVAANSQIVQVIRSHKFALLLTGHAHYYQHPTADSGRDLIMGTGGAPLRSVSSGAFHGFGMVDQLPSGQLQVTVYDLNSASPFDQWTVGPNQ